MFSPPWMGFRITVGELPESASSHFLLSALICNMVCYYALFIQSNAPYKCSVMADYFISSFLIRYETWKRTFGWQNHSRLCVKQICLPSTTSNVTNDKTKLWKTVRLTSFQKPKLQSVSISLKYVHPCFLLYLLCYSYFLLTSWAVIF